MSNCLGCGMNENRDIREETLLNSSESISLKYVAGKLGLSKSATLRFGLLQLANDISRKERAEDTGVST